jgi:hypothetical protein
VPPAQTDRHICPVVAALLWLSVLLNLINLENVVAPILPGNASNNQQLL